MNYIENVKHEAAANPYFTGYLSLPDVKKKEIGGALLENLNIVDRDSIYQKTTVEFKRNLGNYSKLLFDNCMRYLEDSQDCVVSCCYEDDIPF